MKSELVFLATVKVDGHWHNTDGYNYTKKALVIRFISRSWSYRPESIFWKVSSIPRACVGDSLRTLITPLRLR